METVTDQTTQVLTDDELKFLKTIQTDTQNLTWELGDIGLIRAQLDKRDVNAKLFLDELEKREKELNASLLEKYGKISLNLETGAFTKID